MKLSRRNLQRIANLKDKMQRNPPVSKYAAKTHPGAYRQPVSLTIEEARAAIAAHFNGAEQ